MLLTAAPANTDAISPQTRAGAGPNRTKLVSADLLRQFREGARATLARRPGNLAMRLHVADLTRALGAFHEAAALYEEVARISNDPSCTLVAAHTAALLKGEPAHPLPEGSPGPVPFVRRTDALPCETVDALWDFLSRNRSRFCPSGIYVANDEIRVDTAKRNSLKLKADDELRGIVQPHLSALLSPPANWAQLGLRSFQPTEIEMEVAIHTDGGRFTAHRDSGRAVADRILTFIFYLHREPRRFSGGDLLLYDEAAQLPGFTRVDPAHNSVLLFPSHALHEVLPIQSDATDLLDGRITIHGWLRNSTETPQ